MSKQEQRTDGTPKRRYRAAGPLPPPPQGVEVKTRIEAAEFFGAGFKTFSEWERQGRVTIPRYRADSGAGRAIYYAVKDLECLREEFARRLEPYPDPERPGVYRVPISSRLHDMEALIDEADLPKVRGRKWNVHRRGGSEEIEVILSTVSGPQTPLKRIIMGVDAPECKDRIVCLVNGDPLDCRRSNLTITTLSHVNMHKPKSMSRGGRPKTSAYRGVDWDFNRKLWRAQVGTRDKHRVLGRFRDEAQAAAAYDAAVREMFGATVPLNFPDGVIPEPTFMGYDGQPVREKNKYRVPRGLPTPPEGVAMLTREQAADMLEVSAQTFGHWLVRGEVTIARYRAKDQTGTPIVYAAADIARLREEFDKVGQPYPDPDPARAGVWRVPLRTLSGYIEALIDEVDLPIVQGKKWNFVTHSGHRHARGVVVQVGSNEALRRQLNRLIMGLEGEGQTKRIVHANGNPLDCRRCNLVVSTPQRATRAGYKLLHRSGRPTTSRFKGVCWIEREAKWQSQIRIDDKPKLLGMFEDEEDAALAYDEAAREVWGSEARVNFPRPGELPSAAAPVAPEYLWAEGKGPMARPPGKPSDFSAQLNADGSVTLSWRSTNAAASSGVTFAVSRRLPGQSEFVRIGTADGSTSLMRRPIFVDATVPASVLAAEGQGAEYIVQGSRGTLAGEVSAVLVVQFGGDGTLAMRTALTQAA